LKQKKCYARCYAKPIEVDFLQEKCWSCDSQLGMETVSGGDGGGGDEL